MKDFFSTLASRVRPTAPPVEPRRTSIFESVKPEPAPMTRLNEPPPEVSAQFTPKTSQPYPRQAETLRAPAFPKTESPAVQPASVPASAKESAPSSNVTPAITRPVEREPPRFAPQTTLSILPPAPAPQASPFPPLPSAPPGPSQVVVTEKFFTTAVPPQASPPQPKSPVPSAQPSAPPLFAPVVTRLIEPVPRAAEPSASRDSSAEPSPIHVTIGRVEVRAIIPAASTAPAPAVKKPSPIIALDDYLKRPSRASRA